MRGLAVLAILGIGAVAAHGQTIVNPDGGITIRTGTTFEVVSMLDTGVKHAFPGQPYSDKVTVTTVLLHGRNGGPETHTRTERNYRDGDGRERFESGNIVRLADPVGGFGVMLITRQKVARVTRYTPPPYNAANAKRTEELKAEGKAKREARPDRPLLETLPEQTISGVRAEGVRETYTIPAGREGNAADVRIVVEIWTSPELKIVVASSLDDPRSKKETLVVSDLARDEPDPKLFQIPPDYEAVDTATGAVTGPH